MNRRAFLQRVGAGAVVWPTWLSRSFLSQESDPGPARRRPAHRPLEEVIQAQRRARAVGKPLLVFVVPEDEDGRWERGSVLGEALNHGGVPLLADLALCEVVCAEAATVRDALRIDPISGDPLALLLYERSGRLAVREIPASVPSDEAIVRFPTEPMDEASWERAIEGAIRERILRVAEALRRGIAPNRTAIRALAAAARPTLTPEELARLESIVRGAIGPDLDLVDRGAAIVRAATEENPNLQARLIPVLADAASKRLVAKPPPGARWARKDACGGAIEEDEAERARSVYVLCGMGYMSELSSRFLRFFADRG